MHALFHFLSPSGRLQPRPFVLIALAVYAAGAASQLFTTPDMIVRGGLWLFAVVQALLIWTWFSVHAKRLRDAGRPTGVALGASVLYGLSVILLLILVAGSFNTSIVAASDANTTSALGLILLLTIIATLLGSPHYDLTWFVVAILTAMALVPLIVAVAVTAWAATRPSAEQRTA